MNPPGVMQHFVKVKLYQVQLKIDHTKCFQISLKIIASCSKMFNCRMPNCTTVVQTASDLLEPEIQPNSPKKWHFSALYPTKNLRKSFSIVQLMKQRLHLCFAFVCNSTENTGFLKFCRFCCVFQWKSYQNLSKIHKMTFCMQRSMCEKVTNFKSLKVPKLMTLK